MSNSINSLTKIELGSDFLNPQFIFSLVSNNT